MPARYAINDEIDSWNEHILGNADHGNVFQSFEFSEQKRLNKWFPKYIVIDLTAMTVLEKVVPPLGKLWYIPKGPGVISSKKLANILLTLREFAKNEGVFLLKIEPELIRNSETIVDFMKLGLVQARPIQPNFSTVLIDISSDLDTVLKNLNQKGRHAIRRAERDGVVVKQVESNRDNCQMFYDLLRQTAEGSFSIRPYNYYEKFWQNFSDAGVGQLFFAYVNDNVVAGAYGLCFGTKSTYKDGASVRSRSVYGASHLLQWNVIKWAHERGAVVHDLCGAPPRDQINNPDHPHYGIGRFKTSFNKEVTDYVGVFDLPIKTLSYTVWTQFGEKIARRIARTVHHESFY